MSEPLINIVSNPSPSGMKQNSSRAGQTAQAREFQKKMQQKEEQQKQSEEKQRAQQLKKRKQQHEEEYRKHAGVPCVLGGQVEKDNKAAQAQDKVMKKGERVQEHEGGGDHRPAVDDQEVLEYDQLELGETHSDDAWLLYLGQLSEQMARGVGLTLEAKQEAHGRHLTALVDHLTDYMDLQAVGNQLSMRLPDTHWPGVNLTIQRHAQGFDVRFVVTHPAALAWFQRREQELSTRLEKRLHGQVRVGSRLQQTVTSILREQSVHRNYDHADGTKGDY